MHIRANVIKIILDGFNRFIEVHMYNIISNMISIFTANFTHSFYLWKLWIAWRLNQILVICCLENIKTIHGTIIIFKVGNATMVSDGEGLTIN